MPKILTTVGLLDESGKLTQAAKERFFLEVLSLLQFGNLDGKGMKNVLTAILPIPPSDPTPKFIDPITKKEEQIFYFGPDPFAALLIPTLPDKTKCPVYHAIWIDGMFEKLANALNVEGGAVAPPVMDPTLIYPDIKIELPLEIPILSPPDFPKFVFDLIKPDLSLPDFQVELLAKIPDIIPPFPTFPTIPNIPMPTIPGFPTPDLTLPKITIGLLLDIFPKVFQPSFIIDFVAKLPDFPGGLLKFIFDLIFEILIKILNALKLLMTPKLLIATLLVTVKNIAVMLIVDIIGLAIGAGAICKITAAALGLV